MVQSIENLSVIAGLILARRAHPSLAEHDFVELQLERADDVPGKANLLANRVGSVVLVAVRRGVLGDARPGMRLRCRAKRTLDGALCESEPAPGLFELGP
jgi:hypothetical protein